MSTAVLTLEGLKSISFDESAVINNETFPGNYRNFKDFCYLKIFNTPGLIEIQTNEYIVIFDSDWVVSLEIHSEQ